MPEPTDDQNTEVDDPVDDATVQDENTTDTTEDAEAGEQQEPETFDREYVEKLRKENGKYRQRAQKADTLAKRLHTELVRATGRLADPDDLPYDEAHLEDADALGDAIEELLTRKPHLASRKPHGDIGQGAGRDTPAVVDLAAMLRQRAG